MRNSDYPTLEDNQEGLRNFVKATDKLGRESASKGDDKRTEYYKTVAKVLEAQSKLTAFLQNLDPSIARTPEELARLQAMHEAVDEVNTAFDEYSESNRTSGHRGR